ncbi:hypothetical protein ACO0K3_03735 [Undibacterium sp. Rencai35W]|uniref:hypothetical protein n=1 Tax=Undibacterium sp. Rencai35W TaxID=3413046 RepID=UPI003BF31BE0
MDMPVRIELPTNPEELKRCLDDPFWRLTSGALYKIIIKGDDGEDDLVMPFIPNRAQRRLLARLHHRNVILKARQLGFCVSPETRVLTADLKWIPIGQIEPGMEVVACDEHPPGGRGKARRMRTAQVQAVKTMQAERFKITFDDGREVVCTDRHPWLSKKAGDLAQWRSLSGNGNEVVGKLKVGTKVRWIAKPWEESTFEDGWFGGILDGEGSISKSNTSAGVNVSQREGKVWDRMNAYCQNRGYSHCIENDIAVRPSKFGKVPVPKIAFGRIDELFRVIGQTRPIRFVGNRFWEGREFPGKRNGDVGWATITKIEAIGMGEVVDMQTSTGTYIAEGFVSHNTTLIAILWLDTALFSNSPIKCGIIAQDKDTAEEIFRDKVKFAYDNLPEALRDRFPLSKCNVSTMIFGHNGAIIKVATSVRGGTIHRLHVSEFGKICAKFPEKAQEVITGSIPAVPKSGISVIESTAEGQDGEFYKITKRAQASQEQGAKLSAKDYRLHFFAWWEAPEYTLDPSTVMVSPTYHVYFNNTEQICGVKFSAGQRAWYVATCESDFSGDQTKMWQEYPSFPDEAFQVSTEGCYYAEQMSTARKQGRLLQRIPVLQMPVNTFWDLGRGDASSIWFHQFATMQDRFLNYYENSGEDLKHYATKLQELSIEYGYVYGTHYLPHDADHKRLGEDADTNRSLKEILEGLLPGHKFEIVPRITNLQAGIQATRGAFSSAWFDETNCAVGLKRLGNYRKKWNKATGSWSDEHVHDENSHGADAFRQWGQEKDRGNVFSNVVRKKTLRRAGSFMAR